MRELSACSSIATSVRQLCCGAAQYAEATPLHQLPHLAAHPTPDPHPGTWEHDVTLEGGTVVVSTKAGRVVRIPCTQHPKPAEVGASESMGYGRKTNRVKPMLA